MHCDDLHSAGSAVARQGKHAQSADADAPPMSPHGAKRSRATLRDSPRAANQPGAEAMDVQGGSSAQEEAGTRGPLELTVTTHRSAFDEEEYQLYRRYQIAVHESSLDELERSHYERFLVDTPLTFVPPDAENLPIPPPPPPSAHKFSESEYALRRKPIPPPPGGRRSPIPPPDNSSTGSFSSAGAASCPSP